MTIIVVCLIAAITIITVTSIRFVRDMDPMAEKRRVIERTRKAWIARMNDDRALASERAFAANRVGALDSMLFENAKDSAVGTKEET